MAGFELIRSQRIVNLVAANLATAAAYVAAGWLGFQLNLPGTVASPVWPPSGLMLAAVMLYGRGVLPGVAVGTALFDTLLFPSAVLETMLLDSIGATLEPLIATTIIRRGRDDSAGFFADWRGCLRFVLGASAGTGSAAIFGILSFVASGLIPVEDWLRAFATWWAGNLAACLSISPLLILIFSGNTISKLMVRPFEAVLVLVLLPATSGALFSLHLTGSMIKTLEILAVPVLVFAAYRFHTVGATVAVFVASVAALVMAKWGLPPDVNLADGLLQLQLFLTTSGGLTLLLASERADRLQALARAAEAQHAAEEANRAKTLFLANMSHELRTPLNAVIGFSDMMSQQIFGPLGHPKYQEYASYISSSGTHLLRLISDILDMAKVEVGKIEMSREDVTVTDVLDEAAMMVESRAAEAGITLVNHGQDDVQFFVDRRCALQVALNLITNSIKFTPRGGTIRLEVVADGALAGFRVHDTGIGMAPEDIPRVLQPFYQVRRSDRANNEGVGLGLPIARDLVLLHGGQFEIESSPRRGTVVTAVFPVSPPPLPPDVDSLPTVIRSAADIPAPSSTPPVGRHPIRLP